MHNIVRLYVYVWGGPFSSATLRNTSCTAAGVCVKLTLRLATHFNQKWAVLFHLLLCLNKQYQPISNADTPVSQ